MEEKKRVRFVPDGLSVREANEGEGESRVIEGRAIVFDRETVLYDSASYKQCEMIKPSCITEEFLREQDIKLNLLHNSNWNSEQMGSILAQKCRSVTSETEHSNLCATEPTPDAVLNFIRRTTR